MVLVLYRIRGIMQYFDEIYHLRDTPIKRSTTLFLLLVSNTYFYEKGEFHPTVSNLPISSSRQVLPSKTTGHCIELTTASMIKYLFVRNYCGTPFVFRFLRLIICLNLASSLAFILLRVSLYKSSTMYY